MTAPHHDDPLSRLSGTLQVGTLITLISLAAKTCLASLQIENPPEMPVSIAFWSVSNRSIAVHSFRFRRFRKHPEKLKPDRTFKQTSELSHKRTHQKIRLSRSRTLHCPASWCQPLAERRGVSIRSHGYLETFLIKYLRKYERQVRSPICATLFGALRMGQRRL
jgi:hypothetical protein